MKTLLLAIIAVVCVDDVLIGDRNQWEQNKNLKRVMNVLSKVGMHVNAKKV